MRGTWLGLTVFALLLTPWLPGQAPARPPDQPRARADWFARFRQSQDSESPAQHRFEALQQARAMTTLHRRLSAAPAGTGAPPAVLGGDWTELGPRPEQDPQDGAVAGRISALAVDLGKDPTGNTVYVGAADGGLWLSTNALSAQPSFTPIGDNLPSLAIGSIALDDTTTPTTIYVGTGEPNESEDTYYSVGILKSTDGGHTWTTGGGPVNFFGSAISKLLVDPKNPQLLLAAVTEAGVFVRNNDVVSTPAIGIVRSSDGGATWTQVNSGATATDLLLNPANGDYYAPIRGQGFARSSDGGQTWQITGSPYGATPVSVDNFYRVSMAERAGVLYALVSDSKGAPTSPGDCNQSANCSGVIESQDGGATWGPLPTPANLYNTDDQGNYDQSIAAPAGSSLLVIGGIDLWSADLAQGVSWNNLTNAYGSGTVHADEHAIVAVDANHWYIGNDGGIWATANAGTTWSNLNATLGTIQFYSVTPDPATAGRLLGGSQDNGTALGSGLSAQQQSWNLVWGGDGGHTAINPANPQQLFTENFNVSLRQSDDGGASFTSVVDTKTITDPSEFYVPFVLGPQDPGTAYLATTRVWRGPATASGGVGWAAISPDLTHANPGSQEQDDLTAIAVAPSSADVIYAGAYDGSVSVTTNATAAAPTWTTLASERGPVSAIAVSPSDPKTVYWGMGFIGGGAGIFKSSGGTITTIGGNLPGTPINAIAIDPANPNNIFVATDVGVFAAGDGGIANELWARVGDNLPAAAVLSLALTSAGGTPTLIAGTHGRGAWSIPAIAPPSFTMTVTPAKLTVEQGQPEQFTVQTTASNGASSVTLSCQNESDCTFNPATLAAGGSSTLTIAPSPLFAFSTTITVVGTSSFGTQSQAVNLEVLDFLFGLGMQNSFVGPTGSASVAAGQSVNAAALVQDPSFIPYDAPIQFSCPQAPAGISCAFSPTSIPALTQNTAVTIQVTAAATVAPGTYTVTAQAVGGTITEKATINLTITPFAITATPAVLTAVAGTGAQFTVAAQTWSNFTGAIALSCSLPNLTGGACSFQPASITAGQSSTATVTGFLGFVQQPVIFTGSGGGSNATASAQIEGADFQISKGFAFLDVIPGADSVAFTLTSSAGFGFDAPIALSCSSAAGLTCGFNPASLTPGQSSQVTVSGLAKLAPSSGYPVTITGTSGNLQHATTATVANDADFSLTEQANFFGALPGSQVTFQVIANGDTPPVSVACGQSPGLVCSLSPAVIQYPGAATVVASGWGAAGVPIVGSVTEGGATLTHTLQVQIPAADFSLTAAPATVFLAPGGTGHFNVTVASATTLFSAKLNFTCGGLPANAQCTAPAGAQTVANGTAVPFSITVAAAAAIPARPHGEGGWPWAMAACMLLMAALIRRRRPLLAAVGMLLLASVACGGGSGSGGGSTIISQPPPPVVSTITITATDATPGLANPTSHTTTVQLSVTPQ